MIASLRLFPKTHSLQGGLGYVHIGQVGRSELSAYTAYMKKPTRKYTKSGMIFGYQTLEFYNYAPLYLWHSITYIYSALATVFVTDVYTIF